MQPANNEWEQLKTRIRSTWMAGDFGQIAQYSEACAQEFVVRLHLRAGLKVLDVACGTGNLAIPAARTGALVAGVDIAPNLLELAGRKATSEGLTISFDEGDAEALPYADAQFDVAMSMFGAMFAPHPERAAAELARVVKEGGTIAMANWTPRGFSGKMFALAARYVAPPLGIPSPVLWGDEVIARERLIAYSSGVEVTRREIEMEYPFSPREVVQLFRDYFGPTKVAFARLDAGGQAAYAADLEALWAEHNELTGGGTRIRNEYLEVIAKRT